MVSKLSRHALSRPSGSQIASRISVGVSGHRDNAYRSSGPRRLDDPTVPTGSRVEHHYMHDRATGIGDKEQITGPYAPQRYPAATGGSCTGVAGQRDTDPAIQRVREPEQSLATDQRFGIWGGITPTQRRGLTARRHGRRSNEHGGRDGAV